MTIHSVRRLALVLGLLSAGAFAAVPASLANPWQASPWSANPWSSNAGLATPGLRLGWVQAQRAWAEQSYRQTQRRLDQLEQCLNRARQRWDRDQCLRRDEQARERQWQRDQQEWQALMRHDGSLASQPWRPGY